MKLHSLPLRPALAVILSIGAQLGHAADTKTTTAAPIAGMLRVLKADGKTVLGQALVNPGTMLQIGVRAADAIAAANGRCAFNVQFEEVSPTALPGTTTRLYSNDALVASVTKLDLAAKTGKSYVTQPYLFAGRNNVKVVFNADAAVPTVGWVQVVVDGTCATVTAAPVPVQPPAPVLTKPGSADWNLLFTAYGYSNYAVTGLKGKGYRRYAELVEVNTALAAMVKAGAIERTAGQALLARWNSLANDAEFKAAMAKVAPGTDKRG